MKFIKYIAAALLLTMGFVSCDTFAEEDGTPGQTTVQFAQAEIPSDYGSGYINIPLTITSDTEEGMNSCNVSVKIKPVVTGEPFEGKHNETGKKGDGEYIITTFDLNFPAYDKYYDEKDPKKYYDEETKKWTKTVNLELKIVNTEPDDIRATFEIESSTTTIGEQKQCRVVLTKSDRDRMCGTFAVSYTDSAWYDGTDEAEYPVEKYAWTEVSIRWETTSECFVCASEKGHVLYGYYDAETKRMQFAPLELLAPATEDYTVFLVSQMYDATTEATSTEWRVNTEFKYDDESTTITFPENIVVRFGLWVVDPTNDYDLVEYMYDGLPGYKGVVFTKIQ